MLVRGVSQQLVQRQDVPGDLQRSKPQQGISRGRGGMREGWGRTEGSRSPPAAASNPLIWEVVKAPRLLVLKLSNGREGSGCAQDPAVPHLCPGSTGSPPHPQPSTAQAAEALHGFQPLLILPHHQMLPAGLRVWHHHVVPLEPAVTWNMG